MFTAIRSSNYNIQYHRSSGIYHKILREVFACNKAALPSSMIYVLLSTGKKCNFNTANKE